MFYHSLKYKAANKFPRSLFSNEDGSTFFEPIVFGVFSGGTNRGILF